VTLYTVNGTVTFSAWCDVEADSPEAAVEEARERDERSGWEWDEGTGEIDMEAVTPQVEVKT
jgi:hypothetical protein